MSSSPVNPPRMRARVAPATGSRRPPWPSLTLVAVSFGIIEAILVAVYRTLLDPEGDLFPLLRLPAQLLPWERLREAATLVLLAGMARLAATPKPTTWAAFFYLFSLWDLTYYASLRVVLVWPRSLSDWDLLFLLPVPWLAPVYAPVLVSCVLLGVGVLTLRFAARRGSFRTTPLHAAAAVLGGGLGVWSFIAHPGARALEHLPPRYPVEFLLAGLTIGLAAYAHAYRSNLRRDRSQP